jgi:iron complex transport system ATP-binding protein
MIAWTVRGVTLRYPRASRAALDGVSVDIPSGGCTAVLGPNGSGKSTLLRVLLGTAAVSAGSVTAFGRPIGEWTRMQLARQVGVVPQGEVEAFPMTARALVAMGRYPYLGPWRAEGPRDAAAITEAMARCDVAQFAERSMDTLSGGERQRVRLARALAQEPAALALDEPTTSLDLRHEMTIVELLRRLADAGTTIVLVTHNLGIAARYADQVVLLNEGRLAAAGPTGDVLTAARIEQVFGWPVDLVRTGRGGTAVVPVTP